ncbi:unnamed protein product [Microthlaspi erraticum]|uniref:Uncharacterized protein n=1 Tax=Microthlaspi erraticum TaxID=1685480 RepID=A0A6D2LC84_9BRAS|nr:unnamed protein product [Microthlaspi erraticum]
MESWAEFILSLLEEVVQKPTILIGNSVATCKPRLCHRCLRGPWGALSPMPEINASCSLCENTQEKSMNS